MAQDMVKFKNLPPPAAPAPPGRKRQMKQQTSSSGGGGMRRPAADDEPLKKRPAMNPPPRRRLRAKTRDGCFAGLEEPGEAGDRPDEPPDHPDEPPDELPEQCQICGSRGHDTMECFWVPPGFWEQADAGEAARSLRPAHKATPGRFVAEAGVTVEAVPGDGNCLFEVAHRGFHRLWGPESPCADGKGLRSSVVSYIAAHPDEEFMGLSLAQWLWHERKLTPAEYKKEMSKPPHGLSPSTWGGALETGVMCQMYGCRLLTWERVQGGYELINEALPPQAKGAGKKADMGPRTISIIWTGLHYNLAVGLR